MPPEDSIRQRLEKAEQENAELKRSLYELSMRLSAALARPSANADAPAAERSAGERAVDESHAIAAATAMAASSRGDGSPSSRSGHHKRGNGGDGGSGRGFEPLFDLNGHSGAVYAVRFSPTGRLLASGSFDHTTRLWSRGGEPVATLRGHSHSVTDLCFSADSAAVLSGSFDHTARLWDVGRSQCVSCFDVGGALVLSVACRGDLCWAATSSGVLPAVCDRRHAAASEPSRNLPAGALLQYDRRRRGEQPCLSVQNESLLQAVASASDEEVLTGDRNGLLKARHTLPADLPAVSHSTASC